MSEKAALSEKATLIESRGPKAAGSTFISQRTLAGSQAAIQSTANVYRPIPQRGPLGLLGRVLVQTFTLFILFYGYIKYFILF